MPIKQVIDFSIDFGGTVEQFKCAHCGDIYLLEEKKINSGITYCWKCHQPYLQRLCTTNTPSFIINAVHRVKGS